jgi:hypothetical protein
MWRILLILACVLVFSFALHAKVAGYGPPFGPHPSTSSKLWLNGDKLHPPVVAPAPAPLWLAAFLAGVVVPRTLRNNQLVFAAATVAHHRMVYQRRFLRPPPRA